MTGLSATERETFRFVGINTLSLAIASLSSVYVHLPLVTLNINLQEFPTEFELQYSVYLITCDCRLEVFQECPVGCPGTFCMVNGLRFFFFIFLQNFATAFCQKVNRTFMIQIKTKQSKKQQEAADNIQAALCPKAWRICTKVSWTTNWQLHISSASKKH